MSKWRENKEERIKKDKKRKGGRMQGLCMMIRKVTGKGKDMKITEGKEK